MQPNTKYVIMQPNTTPKCYNAGKKLSKICYNAKNIIQKYVMWPSMIHKISKWEVIQELYFSSCGVGTASSGKPDSSVG